MTEFQNEPDSALSDLNDSDGEVVDFVDSLVDLVKTARLERGIELEIRIREKVQDERWRDLDLIRTELYWAERGLLAGLDTDPEDVLEAEIRRVEQDIDYARVRIEELRALFGHHQNDLQRKLARAFSIDRGIDTSKAPPGTIRFSTAFWGQLRRVKAGTRLLAKDLKSLANATVMESLAKDALADAIELVQHDARLVETKRADPQVELTRSIAKLEEAMQLCRWHVVELEKWKSIVVARRRQQRSNEAIFLLETAGPILEAERLIPVDRIRISLVEDERPGEPMLFLNLFGELLTQRQKDKIRAQSMEAIGVASKRRKVLERLNENYYEDLKQFLKDNPGRSKDEFDQEHLWYKMQITQQLQEADFAKDRIINQAMKADLADERYDFAWDARDDKHKEPRTAVQLEEKAGRHPEAAQKVAQWMQSLPRDIHSNAHDDTSTLQQSPEIDYWLARSVDFQDGDRYSVLSLEMHSDRQIKRRLLIRYKAQCKTLRADAIL